MKDVDGKRYDTQRSVKRLPLSIRPALKLLDLVCEHRLSITFPAAFMSSGFLPLPHEIGINCTVHGMKNNV